jgi:hypothetical protein
VLRPDHKSSHIAAKRGAVSQTSIGYDATMNFLGQSTITELTSERGAGETYCLAHHLTVADGRRRFMMAPLRDSDIFVKRQRMAICRAPALRGLAGGAETIGAAPNPNQAQGRRADLTAKINCFSKSMTISQSLVHSGVAAGTNYWPRGRRWRLRGLATGIEHFADGLAMAELRTAERLLATLR